MRYPILALAAAAALSLAACKPDSPIAPRQLGLDGAWGRAPAILVASGPDGQVHDFEYSETWRLGPGGRFDRQAWYYDRATGKLYAGDQDQGTFTDRDGVLALSVVTELRTTLDQFVTSPEQHLAPEGEVLYYAYTLQGDDLSVAPSCPPGAECPQPLPTVLHRLPLLID